MKYLVLVLSLFSVSAHSEVIELDCQQQLAGEGTLLIGMTIDTDAGIVTDQNQYWKGFWKISSIDQRYIEAIAFKTLWKKDNSVTENSGAERVISIDRYTGRVESPNIEGFLGFKRHCEVVKEGF